MKYLILASLFVAFHSHAQTFLGSGYSPNSGFEAPGAFAAPMGSGQTNTIPSQTTTNQTAIGPGTGAGSNIAPPIGNGTSFPQVGAPIDQMNTAPTPAPSTVNESSDSFGTTLQTKPLNPGLTEPGPTSNQDIIKRQAQEDSLDYSTTPQMRKVPDRSP